MGGGEGEDEAGMVTSIDEIVSRANDKAIVAAMSVRYKEEAAVFERGRWSSSGEA